MISLFVLKPRTRHRNQKPPTQAPPPHPITLSNCGVCAHASSSSSSRALRRILSRCTEALEVASTSAFLRTRWEGAACTSILWLPLQTLPQSLREQQEIERLDDNDGLLQTLILLPRGGIGDAIPTSSMTVSRQISIFCIYIRSACILDLSYTSWVTKVSVPINIIITVVGRLRANESAPVDHASRLFYVWERGDLAIGQKAMTVNLSRPFSRSSTCATIVLGID